MTKCALFGLTFWIAVSLKSTQAQDPTLAVRTNVQNHSINTRAKSYTEFVETSTVFVDNTLLIRDILCQSEQVIFLICPPKWGKTMNLLMLKSFFEAKINDDGEMIQALHTFPSFQIFRNGHVNVTNDTDAKFESPLLISNYSELMRQFQARHPVIYLSFKNVVGQNYSAVEKKMRAVISRVVGQHSYLNKILKIKGADTAYGSHDKDKFNRIVSQHQSERLSTSLKFLCRVLRDHFKRKAFLFFDDYDTPLLSALHYPDFPPRDLGRLLYFMDELFVNTFLGNSHLYKAVLTGTFLRRHPRWEFYSYEYIADRGDKLNKYFGFSRPNVESLFKKFSIPDDLAKQAHRWYGGQLGDYYMPWSIVNFLKFRELTTYWKDVSNEPFVEHQLKKHDHSREILLKVLSDKTISVVNQMPIDELTIYDMKKSYISFTTYLSENGFLTKIRGVPDIPVWSARVPNKEVKHITSTWLLHHCRNEYNVTRKLANLTSVALDAFENDKSIDVNTLQQTLQKYYKGNGSFPESTKFSHEFFHATFECFLVQMQVLSDFEVDVYYQEMLVADVVMVSNATQRGTIIELDYDKESAKDALQRAQKHERVLKKFADLKYIRFLGISLSQDRTVNIMTKLRQ